MDFYYTIESPIRNEIKVTASKFICSVSPLSNKDDAMFFVEQIRSEFHDASHNCFAYIFGKDGLDYRYSDDGEPRGSAGKPILLAIQKSTFSDIVVVVTRFFGGTKLGVGNLARAYGDAANETLSLCTPRKIDITSLVEVFCTYEDVSVVKKLISEIAISSEEQYMDACRFDVRIPISKTETFIAKIIDNTNGRAGCKRIG